MKIIIDAKDTVLGRLGTYAAKELLKGKDVVIINSEEAIISGNKKDIVEKIKNWKKKGGSSQNGPKISRMPHRLVKRMLRGMLPWDRTKGREAYKRLICHIGNGDLSEEDLKKAIKLNIQKPLKYVIVKEIVKII